MRKLFFVIIAALALAACDKISPEPEAVKEITASNLVFNVKVDYPTVTRATKTGWESGDVIFLFFKRYNDFYVKLTYDGSAWTGEVGPENAIIPLDFTAEEKTVTAVYLPFHGHLTPQLKTVNGRHQWIIGEDRDYHYTYYMIAVKAPYTFKQENGEWVLSATLQMKNPASYVQFWVEDATAESGDYLLSTDAVVPDGFYCVNEDGDVKETSNNYDTGYSDSPKDPGDDMIGYKYKGGVLFSGKLATSYPYTGNYYFILTDGNGKNRRDYFVKGKTLESHSAVKLPARSSDKWKAVGPADTVKLTKNGVDLGTWYACNYYSESTNLNAYSPNGSGTRMSYTRAIALEDLNTKLPTKEDWEKLIANCDWTRVSMRKGQKGMVVQGDSDYMFLRDLPGNPGVIMYWSSTSYSSGQAWDLHAGSSQDIPDMWHDDKSSNRLVRLMKRN